ncbi:MAG TPA: EAL domain-containing protein [Gaiellales bacterium]
MRPPTSRLSLLGRFSLMSLAVIATLGLAIGLTLKRQIEQRALARASQLAEVVAELGVRPRLERDDLVGALPARRIHALDAALRDFTAERGVTRMKVFNGAAQIVYADDHSLIGEDDLDEPGVREALHGGRTADLQRGVADDRKGMRTLEVYVPLHFDDASGRTGALEIDMPYAPVANEIYTDLLTVYLLLGVGLAVLFVALFRIVAGASRRLRHQALHDGLTGLPNRSLLYSRLRRAIGSARGDRIAALMLIDLDRFKEVNDTLGHDHGDELLVEVAARLRGALRRGDTLARLGGDEFAVLLPDLPERAAVAELAGRLQDALGRPFALRGVAVELEASIGVALCPDHGDDVHTLVQRADVAMYDAKRSQAGIATYSADRDPYSADRLGLLAELRRAIERDELVLHYQPKVSVDGGDVIGVEALVRWQHPTRGLLAPAEFVPLAERTGTVAELTRWVVATALRQARAWIVAGRPLPIAVNLAAANIVDVTLPDAIAALLAEHRVPGGLLECEISEHTVMADPLRAMEVLGRLRDMGLRLSLDDFGTGHSSLAYLKRLPLDEVKIDRSFVAGMTEDENDAVIVRSTIDLARNLGLDVVAEGVEDAETLHGLGELHCDVAQGFHLSRPLPADELDAWLAAWPGATTSA